MLGGGFKICSILIPIWGNDPIWLYNMFQMGWHHQLVSYVIFHFPRSLSRNLPRQNTMRTMGIPKVLDDAAGVIWMERRNRSWAVQWHGMMLSINRCFVCSKSVISFNGCCSKCIMCFYEIPETWNQQLGHLQPMPWMPWGLSCLACRHVDQKRMWVGKI